MRNGCGLIDVEMELGLGRWSDGLVDDGDGDGR